ncbi:acyl carrier protein [Actinomadura scrupuli]|uniref:acyl carrier protein n=1 Tax=Actinomadura scrupuli TaxID=559629 RepID=UPI003D96D125
MKLFRERDVRRRVTALLGQVRPEIAAMTLRGDLRLQDDLGMDSLSIVALAVRLHEDLGVDLAAIAEHGPSIQTIDDLVAVMESLTHGKN